MWKVRGWNESCALLAMLGTQYVNEFYLIPLNQDHRMSGIKHDGRDAHLGSTATFEVVDNRLEISASGDPTLVDPVDRPPRSSQRITTPANPRKQSKHPSGNRLGGMIQYALSENSANVCLDQASTSPVTGWRRLLSRFTTSHDVSRRPPHRRSTNPELESISPGHSGLTACFATVTGPNPVSSTKHPGQGDFWSPPARHLRRC